MSCVVAWCLLVQCVLEIAAWLLVTVAAHRRPDCVSMTRGIVQKDILFTSNLRFSGRCEVISTRAASSAVILFLDGLTRISSRQTRVSLTGPHRVGTDE